MQSVSSGAVYNALEIKSASSSNANWILQEGSNGVIIGYGFNSSAISLSAGGYYIGYVPSGYKAVNVINANAFADANSGFVTGATHIFNTGEGVVVYVYQSGTFSKGGIRIMAQLSRI